MIRFSTIGAIVGAGFLLGACGGGGSPPAAPPSRSDTDYIVVARVGGPLDPVQDQVSSGVFAPLAEAAAGTPLEAVIRCADEVVTYNVLDLGDTVLAQLQATLLSGGGTPLDPNPAALTAALGSLAANLTQLLESLAGLGEGCTADILALERIDSGVNPLEGTPLAPLGAALGPVLAQIASLVNGSGNAGEDLQLSSVAALVAQLKLALQNGLAQVPAEAYETPIAGAALTTLSMALDDTSALLDAALAYDGPATGAGVQVLLEHTLVNLLTEVVPVRAFEAQAGQHGLISGPIESGAAQLAALLGQLVGTVSTPVLANTLGGALDPVLDPIENELLPALLAPLSEALAGIGGGGGGNPLGPVLGIVQSVLGTLAGGIGGGAGGGDCPFAGLPLLSVLCGDGG
ncbi:hypothetical protein [Sinimarinibacterium thermocellulolyticum]|uniref:Collagen-like protein n=1 Tax=Sinimarinibacterium thermocellulolyticum TaxID=3170016 RepID=A0ABV2A9E3_9GAMM